VLHTLLIDFHFYFVFLHKVLVLALFVSKLGLTIIGLFLGNYPEIVHTLSFILVHSRKVFFFADEIFYLTAFFSKGFLVFIIINIVNGLGCFTSLVFYSTWPFLLRVSLYWLLRRHFCYIS